MCQLSSAILTFKLVNNLAKINFSIQYCNNVHRYSTRNNEDIVTHRTHTQLGAMNFFVRAFLQYNNLPSHIKCHKSISKFKTKLREHSHESVMERYNN